MPAHLPPGRSIIPLPPLINGLDGKTQEVGQLLSTPQLFHGCHCHVALCVSYWLHSAIASISLRPLTFRSHIVHGCPLASFTRPPWLPNGCRAVIRWRRVGRRCIRLSIAVVRRRRGGAAEDEVGCRGRWVRDVPIGRGRLGGRGWVGCRRRGGVAERIRRAQRDGHRGS